MLSSAYKFLFFYEEVTIMRQKFEMEFKLKVVGEYRKGENGYKKLAKQYNLNRDTVRTWVLNPKLNPNIKPKEDSAENSEKTE